jgi:hypothetical protein
MLLLETKPEAYRRGINYLSDQKVALVLWAPFKEFVFVLGDFNNWTVDNSYQMKKDGDYFWLEIDGLEPGQPMYSSIISIAISELLIHIPNKLPILKISGYLKHHIPVWFNTQREKL